MQCGLGPSFPASPLIQDDGLLRRDFARRGFPSARRGCTKKHSEGAFSRQHSAINQTRAIAGSAVLYGYGPTTTNEQAIHFSIDSK
jgi:hypothetical protein